MDDLKKQDGPVDLKKVDAPESAVKDIVNMKRLVNAGDKIKLTIGEFTVRELGFFQLSEIVADSLELIIQLTNSGDEPVTEFEIIKRVLKSQDLKAQLVGLFSAICDEPNQKVFEKMSMKDLTKLIRATDAVLNIEEIKECFLELRQKYQ